MKIAWLSPLPPVKSGIASYSMMLLPRLAELADVTAVVDQTEVDPLPPCPVKRVEELDNGLEGFDVVVAQLGNNIHHEFVWRQASSVPTVLVLHELVMHHLVTEMTLARGEADRFRELIGESEGSPGDAFAHARALGVHFEEGNFLFPASSRIANDSRAVIVHNEWARRRLIDAGVTVPVHVIDHPLDRLHVTPSAEDRRRILEGYGWPEQSLVIGVFGFVTAPKRPQVVLQAFARARRDRSDLRLLFVGESASNVDLAELARAEGLPDDAWRSTGWTSDVDFDRFLGAVDRVVSLRYPTAGESSGAVARVFAAGKPLAISDYAQFSSFPDATVAKVPLGADEVEVLSRFMRDPLESAHIVQEQQSWIRDHGDPRRIAQEYMRVLTDAPPGDRSRSLSHRANPSPLGLLPRLEVESYAASRSGDRIRLHLRLRNVGETELRSHVWGTPAYRLIVKARDDGAELSDWWALPGDLGPGDAVDLSGELRLPNAPLITLTHGWYGAPVAEEEPFWTGEVAP